MAAVAKILTKKLMPTFVAFGIITSLSCYGSIYSTNNSKWLHNNEYSSRRRVCGRYYLTNLAFAEENTTSNYGADQLEQDGYGDRDSTSINSTKNQMKTSSKESTETTQNDTSSSSNTMKYRLMVVYMRGGAAGGCTSQLVDYENYDDAESVYDSIYKAGFFSSVTVIRLYPSKKSWF